MPTAKGIIQSLGLYEWWISSFSQLEQNYIVNKYGPDLVSGNNTSHYSPAGFLAHLSSWVSTKNEYPVAFKIIKQAELKFNDQMDTFDKHFYFMHLIRFYYKNRDQNNNLDKAISYCRAQIAMSREAGIAFKKEYNLLPAHTGFEQLCIFEEKRKNYKEAIQIALRAKKEGWAGDWDKRIDRCNKNLGKVSHENNR